MLGSWNKFVNEKCDFVIVFKDKFVIVLKGLGKVDKKKQ